MRTHRQKQKLKRFMLVKNGIMMALALLCIVFLAAEHIFRLSERALLYIEWFEIGVGLVFLSEFAFEWYHAKDRRFYLKHHWIYLIASVPLPMQTFDILRGVRLLRALRLFRAFAHVRYEENTWLFSAKSRRHSKRQIM